ncbi:YcxB family protein [Sporosarcina contaminans]
MEIRYELTEEDVVAFNVYHVKNSNIGRNSLRWQRLASPLIFLLFAYLLSIFTEIPAAPLLSTFTITAVIWVLFYPKYFYWHITRQVRKMLKEGKNEGLIGEHVLKMQKKGITDSTQNGETIVNWEAIKSFKEDIGHFYLYNSAISAYIIPKREVNADAVRNHLKKWLTL